MSFELEQKRERDLIKETCRQGRCGSCGKKWDKYDEFQEFIASHMNKNTFKTESQINALGIVLKAIKDNI